MEQGGGMKRHQSKSRPCSEHRPPWDSSCLHAHQKNCATSADMATALCLVLSRSHTCHVAHLKQCSVNALQTHRPHDRSGDAPQ